MARLVAQIWSETHALFAQCPAHLDLELLNDDLVGFFNSVPQVRILEAVDMLVRMYRTSHSDVQLSVCINEKSKHFRSVQGKISNIRRHMDWKTVDPVDLTTIVRLSFDCGLFVKLMELRDREPDQSSAVVLASGDDGARLACKLPADGQFPSDLPCEVC